MKNTRISFDMPDELHAFIKMSAAKQGISIKQYILEKLAFARSHENPKAVDVDDKEFDKVMENVLKKHRKLAKDLSKL